MKDALDERADYTKCDFEVIGEGGTIPSLYKFSELITNVNNKITSSYWSCYCSCETIPTPTGRTCKNIKDEDVPTDSSNADTNKIATQINSIKSLVSIANSDASTSYKILTGGINTAYGTFLNAELDILEYLEKLLVI